jgi:hypothetical protein
MRKYLGVFAGKMRIDQGKVAGPFPPDLAPDIWDTLVIIAGTLGELSKERVFGKEFKKCQTQPARDARGERKAAIIEAIIEVRKTNSRPRQPWKEAPAIFGEVNVRLKASGIKEVTDPDYIGKLLDKFPPTDSRRKKFSAY